MSGVIDERITDEIEALEAILLDDVTILWSSGIPVSIETIVHPSTGDDINQQYVCVTLEVSLTPNYPDEVPEVKLRNPRGLDDSVIEQLTGQVKDKLVECLGQPVVFELIELIRENLTECNLPSGQCVICLYGFSPGDVFIKTQCYHYFHSHCLGNHLVAAEKNFMEEMDNMPHWQKQQAAPYKPTCPVCRSGIECVAVDIKSLLNAPTPRDSTAAPPFCLTAEMRSIQMRMAALLARQTAKGGTTDTVTNGPPPISLSTTQSGESSSTNTSSDSPVEDSARNGFENNTISGDKPSSPTSPASNQNTRSSSYKGPFRGLNRRGQPGRRPNYNGQNRGRQGSNVTPQSCGSTTR